MACRKFNKIAQIAKQLLKVRKISSSSSVTLGVENIPSPKSLPIVWSALSVWAAGGAPHLHLYVDKRHKQFGPVFKDKLGPATTIFLSNPAHMREVFSQEGKHPVHIIPEAWMIYNKSHECSRGLFFMDGDEWLHHRRIMNNLLLKGDLTWIEEACQCTSTEVIRYWKTIAPDCDELPNIEGLLYRWSLNTMVCVLLGKSSYERHKGKFEEDLEQLASIVHLIFETSTKFQVFPASLAARLNTPSWQRYVKTATNTLDLANKLILKLLNKVPDHDGLLNKLKTEGLSDVDISRIAVDLVLAAGDTTVYTMLWTLVSMARDQTLQKNLSDPSSSVSAKNVIKESLRLYPVAPFLTRILTKQAKVAGFNIPPGTVILFSAYSYGREDKFFNSADQFNPDRWLREGGEQKLFMPFGLGARSCVGKKIAENQLLTLISDVSRNFKLELMNEQEVKYVLRMVGVPSQSVRLKLSLI